MIVLDANILVALVRGSFARDQFDQAVDRGVIFAVAEPQVAESRRVLDRLHAGDLAAVRAAHEALEEILALIPIYATEDLAVYEPPARERLHPRGQPVWPVLAMGAAIWSRDKGLFGVGVAVWSTRNISFAPASRPSF